MYASAFYESLRKSASGLESPMLCLADTSTSTHLGVLLRTQECMPAPSTSRCASQHLVWGVPHFVWICPQEHTRMCAAEDTSRQSMVLPRPGAHLSSDLWTALAHTPGSSAAGCEPLLRTP